MDVQLPIKTRYAFKDQLKADRATKFIGRGSARSSTNAYAKAFGSLANSGNYRSDDTVFVSAEGDRSGRLEPDLEEIKLACSAGATFITDSIDHRLRDYNVGERQVAIFLRQQGYREASGSGIWRKA